MNFFKVSIFTLFFTVSGLANSTLLAGDNYITVDHGNDVLIDWAWVSDYNVQYYYSDGAIYNELLPPSAVEGWREASEDEFTFFKANVKALDFKLASGGYKNAVEFFNTNTSISVSAKDFNNGDISGEFRENTIYNAYNFFGNASDYWFDTFYVRDTPQVGGSPGSPVAIPEPYSLMLLSIGLLTLSLRRNKK